MRQRFRLNHNALRVLAVILSLPCLLAAGWLFANEFSSDLVSHGPIQHGHADLQCADCHQDSPGTIRQQVQANLRFAIGWRLEPVDFGHAPIGSETCLDCHARPNDRHPIYRFNEPRFAETLQKVSANSCLGCHSEHQAERSFAPLEMCSTCHGDLALKKDPLDVPHVTLIADAKWETCLGCHDFHGNYGHVAPSTLADAVSVEVLRDYLADGPSPYGTTKVYKGTVK